MIVTTTVAAAHSAIEGAGSLLLHARKGDFNECYAFEEEPIEKLCEALRHAVALQLDAHRRNECGLRQEIEMLNQLHGALDRYLEGWA